MLIMETRVPTFERDKQTLMMYVLDGDRRGLEETVEGQLGFVPPRRCKLGVGLMKREETGCGHECDQGRSTLGTDTQIPQHGSREIQ